MRPYRLAQTTVEHLADLKGRMRKLDDQECQAVNGEDAYNAALRGFKESDVCMTLLIDGRPEAVGGVVDAGDGAGLVWLLGTDELSESKEGKTWLLTEAKAEIEKLLSKYYSIFNFVEARQTRIIQWLKRVGFTIGEARPFGVEGKDFYLFYKTGGKQYV